MERVCFRLAVREDMLDEYVRRHRDVWPDMQRALQATGWSNYSLFLGMDGTLIGYFETADLDRALRGMAELEVNRLWQAEMAPFFEGLAGNRPDEAFTRLDEIFHLASAPAAHQGSRTDIED